MKKTLLLTALAYAPYMACAQTGSDYMQALKKADTYVTFNVSDEGKPFRVKWGMDTAWNWDFNVNRGVAHIGKGNFETGRVSFQPNDLVTDNGDGTYTLTARQQTELRQRCNNIKLTGTTHVNINCDHEALNNTDSKGNTGIVNYQGKPEEWYKLIKASVQFVQQQGLTVVSVSPFNEPDYVWNQATNETKAMADFLAIAKLIKADDFFKDIRICGGNTLNDDRALPWYNYLKDYIDEGNTHQLAGSFDNYANFFQRVKADGKVATADELHNVGEAIVGVQYGMENGIWWGFDSKARGQFCIDSNEGVRIGYGENRTAWTSAAVYRNDVTNEVHGYLGASERQAAASSFAFVSKGKDVYFNGYGPTRMYVYDVPGGKAGDYQKPSQINAERLFDITWGEDVAPGIIDGTYQVMNAASGNLLTYNSTSNAQCATRKASGTTQHWKVYPSHTSGDISYWFIDNANTNAGVTKIDLNVLNNNLNAGAGVICWDAGHDLNEQWYVKYAKDGYYYIISRLSNKYLYCAGRTSGSNVSLQEAPTASTTEGTLKAYLWRFLPLDIEPETTAPAAPTQLQAKQRTGSVELAWTASADKDVASYTILRATANEDGSATDWNTIGRGDTLTTFVDNTALQGSHYVYKVVAVDRAGNRSEASDTLHAAPLTGKVLLCQLQFDGTAQDVSANRLDAALYGTLGYSAALKQSGEQSANFNGSAYAMLPYSVALQDEITIATWVRWPSGGSNWQRIFDFGNSTDQYFFFTPSNGSEMRLVLKDGGDEQILTNGKKFATTSWHHLAVTLKPVTPPSGEDGGTVQAIIYIDGENVAETSDFTIRLSDIAPSLCFIGRSMFPADPFFSGRLDDFRIYNYALSAEEVAAVMEDTGAFSKDLDEVNEAVSVKSVATHAQPTQDKAWYDLVGRRTQPSAGGIYIHDGKKILKK